MEFEWDPSKSALNKAKHGIDFLQIQAVWADDNHLAAPGRNQGEDRWLIIGKIDEVLWTVVVTHRKEVVRIISARRARTEEREMYEKI